MWAYIGLVVSSIAYLAVRSLRPSLPQLTGYELRRRYGAAGSETQLQQYELLPALFGLRRLVSGLLLVITAVMAVLVFGVAQGLLVAIGIVLVYELLSRLGFLQRGFRRTLGRFETQLLKFSRKFYTVLSFFAGSGYASPDAHFYSKQELREQIKRDSSVLSEGEKALLIGMLAYEEIKLGDIMTPSQDIVSLEASEALGPVTLDRLHKSGHRWFPVTNDDRTEVVGIFDLQDGARSRDAKLIGDAMRPEVYYLHERMGMEQALHAVLHTGSPMFVVIDDSCEAVGVLVLSDIFNQLLGRRPMSDFDQYDDIEAVAGMAKEQL